MSDVDSQSALPRVITCIASSIAMRAICRRSQKIRPRKNCANRCPGSRSLDEAPTLPLVAAPRGGARIGSDAILASLFLGGPAAGRARMPATAFSFCG